MYINVVGPPPSVAIRENNSYTHPAIDVMMSNAAFAKCYVIYKSLLPLDLSIFHGSWNLNFKIRPYFKLPFKVY